MSPSNRIVISSGAKKGGKRGKQIIDDQRSSTDTALDRRTFLSATAKAAAGVAGAGALLASDPGGVLVDHARLRSLTLRSKAVANISFILNGSPANQVLWNSVSKLS